MKLKPCKCISCFKQSNSVHLTGFQKPMKSENVCWGSFDKYTQDSEDIFTEFRYRKSDVSTLRISHDFDFGMKPRYKCIEITCHIIINIPKNCSISAFRSREWMVLEIVKQKFVKIFTRFDIYKQKNSKKKLWQIVGPCIFWGVWICNFGVLLRHVLLLLCCCGY